MDQLRKELGLPSLPGARTKAGLVVAMAVSAVVVLLKLFTTQVWLADEPTVMLALRSRPSLSNELRVRGDGALPGMHVLVTDENRFVGQGLYEFLTGAGWLVACVVIVGGAGYLRVTARQSRRQ